MTATDLEKALIESAISFGMNIDKESNKRNATVGCNWGYDTYYILNYILCWTIPIELI